MRKQASKNSKLKNTKLAQGMMKKTHNNTGTVNLSKKQNSNPSVHTITSSKRSQRISRYSNVNIAMLNSMRTGDTQQADDIENTLSKQTKLEQRVSILTIKRTMICFFAIIFSIPFFINTTYKAYLSEFQPIAQMVDNVRNTSSTEEYYQVLNFVVENHKDDFDGLVGLEAPPDYVYK